MRRLSEIVKAERGTAVVEMAVVLLFVLAPLTWGILNFGRAMNYFNNTTQLANAGARWAAVDTNPGGGQLLRDYILSQGVTAELRNNSNVHICWPVNPATNTSGKVGDPVQVTVNGGFNWLPFKVLSKNFALAPNIKGTAIMRIERPPTHYAVNPPC